MGLPCAARPSSPAQGHQALRRRPQGPCARDVPWRPQQERGRRLPQDLRVEDVAGKQVLTNFWGMDFTTDKLRSLVRKWQSLIEASVDVKTVDGYVLRCFCIGFTKKRPFQIRKTSYAQSAQIRAIRKKMTDIMTKEVSCVELIKAVEKFVPEFIGKDIMKACEGIYPLQNVFIRKVKILKAPKFDAAKFAEIHSGPSGEEVGAKIAREAKEEAQEGGRDRAVSSFTCNHRDFCLLHLTGSGIKRLS